MLCKFCIFFAVCLACNQWGHAQTSGLGTWSVLNTRLNVNKKLGAFTELQLRSQSFYSDFYYYEVKGGLVYNLNKNFVLVLGGGKYTTYDITTEGSFNKPINVNETRFWEELTTAQYMGRLKFEHRYRIEQRWLNGSFRNRFRYRLTTAIPLNKQTFEPGTLFVAAFNEVFFTNLSPYFERNRVFVGAGYQVHKRLVIQPGYIYQFDYKANQASTGKSFFQLNLLFNFHADPNGMLRLPSTVD